ncbi:MAG: hypothetical protein GY765_10055 [bacterium]|nr:hypothetical protein [bacterium]
MNHKHIAAVVGAPILHSKSPQIFSSWFRHFSQDAAYTRITAETASEAVYLFKELGLKGMSVTAPFKQDIMEYLDHIDEAALAIGGVNTVAHGPKGLTGYNTDFIGVTQSLERRGVVLTGKRCIVLGAGGAGKAAIYGLLSKNATVTVVNRTFEKALQTSRSLGCGVEKIEMLEPLLKETDILVSTLSSSVDIIPAHWLPQTLVVLDANYKKSPLLKNAAARGCTVIRGEEWLLNQAIPAYDYFFNRESQPRAHQTTGPASPPYEPAEAGLRENKQAAPPPVNIALVGFMGSGKSHIGKLLAEKRGLAYKDTDQLIERKAGSSVPDIFKINGEDAFRRLEQDVLKEQLPRHRGVVYSCGGGVVKERVNRDLLRANTLVIWLYSSIEAILKRIPPGTRPLLDCENPGQKARQILNSRLLAYAQSAHLVVNSEKEAAVVVENINEEIHTTFGN